MDSSGGITPPPPPPPPPPGGPGGTGGTGGALPPRGLGDILSAAFDLYKTNAAGLVLIVAAVVVPLTFLSALLSGVIFPEKKETILGTTHTIAIPRSSGVALLLGLVAAVIALIITFVLQAAITRAAAQSTIGEQVDIEGSYRFAISRFGSIFVVAILIALAVGVPLIVAIVLLIVVPVLGVVLLIAAGVFAVYVGILLSSSIPVLVIENKRGTEAMSRSWNLVKGHFWHALGTIIVAGLISGVVSSILRAIGGDNWFLGWIFNAIAQIITTPFTALVAVVLYLDLRARTEAVTADRIRSELASNA